MLFLTAFFKIHDNRVKYNVYDCWRTVEKTLYSVLLCSDPSNLEAQITIYKKSLIFLQAVFNQKVKQHTIVNVVQFLQLLRIKFLPPSVITLPPHRGRGGQINFPLRVQFVILPLLGKKLKSAPAHNFCFYKYINIYLYIYIYWWCVLVYNKFYTNVY